MHSPAQLPHTERAVMCESWPTGQRLYRSPASAPHLHRIRCPGGSRHAFGTSAAVNCCVPDERQSARRLATAQCLQFRLGPIRGCQPVSRCAMSAWELPCHTSPTSLLRVNTLLRLSVGTRQMPLLTLPSGMQRATAADRFALCSAPAHRTGGWRVR